MSVVYVEDIYSEELRIFSRMTEAQLRNRLEPEKGIFIAESPKVIGTALDMGYEPVSMLTEERHIGGMAKDVIARCGDIPVYTSSDEKLAELVGYKLTRGVLCAFRRPAAHSAAEVCENAERIAVLENITDSTNMGAIFRSAAALGMDCVLVTPSCSDPLNRRSVRVSMGTVLQIPWGCVGGSAEEWKDHGNDILREMGFRTAAMALTENSVPPCDERLAAEKRLALMFGTEGDGLMKSTVENADYRVMIPMSRNVDSLNVGAAAAVAFWALGKNKKIE